MISTQVSQFTTAPSSKNMLLSHMHLACPKVAYLWEGNTLPRTKPCCLDLLGRKASVRRSSPLLVHRSLDVTRLCSEKEINWRATNYSSSSKRLHSGHHSPGMSPSRTYSHLALTIEIRCAHPDLHDYTQPEIYFMSGLSLDVRQ